MLESLLTSLVPAVILSVVTFMTTKRKYQAESKGLEKVNDDLSQEIYRKLLDDVNNRIEKLTTEMRLNEQHYLAREVEYKNTIKAANEKINALESKINRLTRHVCLVSTCADRVYFDEMSD